MLPLNWNGNKRASAVLTSDIYIRQVAKVSSKHSTQSIRNCHLKVFKKARNFLLFDLLQNIQIDRFRDKLKKITNPPPEDIVTALIKMGGEG